MSNKFNTEPTVSVGIMSAIEIRFNFHGAYEADGALVEGQQTATVNPDGTVLWNDSSYGELLFKATSPKCFFLLEDVTIGVDFHWERKESQAFRGNLKLLGGDALTAVNIVPVESYLESVISSEMSATASDSLLKAHAVISRSWLLAQIGEKGERSTEGMTETEDERIVWYDRDNHERFDVCADDHCQRYQGITRQTTPAVAEAVAATRGVVLTDADGNLADARFSKCCGGVFEEFESCWQPHHYHYLEARSDSDNATKFPDLRDESNAREWILGNPDAFCNVTDKAVLSQVLNNYDQETPNFYRWKVVYDKETLSRIVRERSGIDFGYITAMEALERGTSGRIIRLRITGTNRSMVIGKELEIRRTLSESHLYSSAFVAEMADKDADGVPATITLYGAGWGHGVGLCQIGAAAMGAQGYDYEHILRHYFPGADLTTLY
ncbi:MAG: SpoIID/LytB domain-containing protein [Muribaculaceae bacterium]|nr:SpoIID/LytB domain-containing protein [Muribaculaceae bacterium]